MQQMIDRYSVTRLIVAILLLLSIVRVECKELTGPVLRNWGAQSYSFGSGWPLLYVTGNKLVSRNGAVTTYCTIRIFGAAVDVFVCITVIVATCKCLGPIGVGGRKWQFSVRSLLGSVASLSAVCLLLASEDRIYTWYASRTGFGLAQHIPFRSLLDWLAFLPIIFGIYCFMLCIGQLAYRTAISAPGGSKR